MSNTNRDLLMQVDVKNSSIKGGGFNFYITDKNTSNFFVQLVIDMSTNPVIHKYVAIENASDYKLILKCIKPNGQLLSIEGTLMNEEESLFQYNLTEEQKDVVGTYQCEYWIYSTVNEQEEIITTAPFNFTVKESIINKLDGVIEDSEDYPILLELIEEVKGLQGNGGGGTVVESHSHDNKETLDTITTEKVEKWDNPVIDDYGDVILAEIPAEKVWEEIEYARALDWGYVDFNCPALPLNLEDEFLIEFGGGIDTLKVEQDYYGDFYAEGLTCSVTNGYFFDKATGSWENDSTSAVLELPPVIADMVTSENVTPFVVKQRNVKQLDTKFLPNDLNVLYSIGMGRTPFSDIGKGSFAMGVEVIGSEDSSFAFGEKAKAMGRFSHAEGYKAEATSDSSFAMGESCKAQANYAHAEGKDTRAIGEAQHVQGKHNKYEGMENYAHIVGNGKGEYNRSNAHTLDWSGNAWFAGNVTVGKNNKELATKEYVDSILGDIEDLLGGI